MHHARARIWKIHTMLLISSMLKRTDHLRTIIVSRHQLARKFLDVIEYAIYKFSLTCTVPIIPAPL